MSSVPLTSLREEDSGEIDQPDGSRLRTSNSDDMADGSLLSLVVEPLHSQHVPEIASAILAEDIPAVTEILSRDSTWQKKQNWFLGQPALTLSVQTMNISTLQLILAAGAKVDEFDGLGYTALHAAAELRWLQGAAMLLEHGASVNAMGSPVSEKLVQKLVRESPLHLAIRTGNLPLVKLMMGISQESPSAEMTPKYSESRSGTPMSGFNFDSRSPIATAYSQFTNRFNFYNRNIGEYPLSSLYSPIRNDFLYNNSERLVNTNTSSPHSNLFWSRLIPYSKLNTKTTNLTMSPSATPTKISESTSSTLPGTQREQADLSIKDGKYRSVVHLAAMSKRTKMLRLILSFKEAQALVQTGDSRGNSALHCIFTEMKQDCCDNEIIGCIDILLEQGLDINAANLRGETPVFVAAKKRCPEGLRHLLQRGGDPRSTNRDEWTAVHAACHGDCSKCLRHLFDTGQVDDFITKETKEGYVPFYLATHSYSLCCLKVLLHQGDNLTYEDSSGRTRCALLLEYIPSAKQFLEELFDECIIACKKRRYDPEYTITFNYSILLSPKREEIQCSVVSELSSSSASTLFTHPLLESFLFKKWNRIKPFFYTNFLLYFLFLTLHTFYVMRTFGPNAKDWSQELVMLNIVRCFHIVVFLLILVPDTIIMLANITKYLRQWETYVKIITLSTSAFIVFSKQVEQEKQIPNDMMLERHVAAVSIFFAWMELMMLLGRFPVLGIYILMFTKVAESIIKFLLAFSSLLIGFALTFVIIFTNEKNFESFPTSLVKTLMMMIGEIDYSAIVEGSGMSMPILGYIILVVFIFLVPILMANLLIGLAVSDLPDLSLHGKIKRLSKQASYLTAYELLIIFFKELRCFPRQLRRVLAERCRIRSKFVIYPNKRNFTQASRIRRLFEMLPTETLERSLEIVHQREEHPQADKDSGDEETSCTNSCNNLYKTQVQQSKLTTTNLSRKFGKETQISSKSRHNSTSDYAGASNIQNMTLDAFEKFETEYKKEFNNLKLFIRTQLIHGNQQLSQELESFSHCVEHSKSKNICRLVNCQISGGLQKIGTSPKGVERKVLNLDLGSKAEPITTDTETDANIRMSKKLETIEKNISEQNKLLQKLIEKDSITAEV